MSEKIKDGGPAFPRAPLGEDCAHPYGQQDGMSLRDWFAGQALAGLLSEGEYVDERPVAFRAYVYADAMLAAREAPDAS